MANNDDFKGGGSPWGSPPRGGGNGSGRGPRPPNIDEVIKKIQDLIKKTTSKEVVFLFLIDLCLHKNLR